MVVGTTIFEFSTTGIARIVAGAGALFTLGDVLPNLRSANEETLLIALIETARGVEEVDRIAGVDGIDVLWIGHFDLTSSLGIPGQFDHREYKRSVDRVLEAAKRHRKTAGFMVSSAEEGARALGQGFRCLAYWGDIWIYSRALIAISLGSLLRRR